jgi:hypothetical protein
VHGVTCAALHPVHGSVSNCDELVVGRRHALEGDGPDAERVREPSRRPLPTEALPEALDNEATFLRPGVGQEQRKLVPSDTGRRVDGEQLVALLRKLNLGVNTEMVERVTIEPEWFKTL